MKRRKKKKTKRGGLILLALLTAALLYGGNLLYGTLFPLEHEALIETYAEEYGVDPYLVYGLIHTESRFQEEAQSPAGAKGLMQITEETGTFIAGRLGMENYQKELLFEPETNLRMGIYYLSYLAEIFPVEKTMLAAYNAGPNRVRGWLSEEAYGSGDTLTEIPFEETRNYVERVTFRESVYRILYFYKRLF